MPNDDIHLKWSKSKSFKQSMEDNEFMETFIECHFMYHILSNTKFSLYWLPTICIMLGLNYAAREDVLPTY